MSEASSNAVIILFAGCAAAFVLTILLIKLIGPKLPRDHGRAFAVAVGASAVTAGIVALLVRVFSRSQGVTGAVLAGGMLSKKRHADFAYSSLLT